MIEMLSIIASTSMIGFSLFLALRKRTQSNMLLAIIFLLLGSQQALDQLMMSLVIDTMPFMKLTLLVQSLLPFLLLLFSLTYSRHGMNSISSRWWVVLVSSILLPLAAAASSAKELFFIPDIAEERILYLEGLGYWIYVASIFYLVLALINIESTFMSLSIIDRRRIRLEFVGIISAVGFMIFYLSQGLLYRAIDMNIVPLRAAVMIVSTSLIGFSMFRGSARVSVGVSRYVVYRSFTLMLLGAYFVILGVTGDAMRYFGISFSRIIMISIAIALAIIMLLLVSSDRLKSRVKIFITKHFFRTKHDYRNEWLRFTGHLSSCLSVEEVERVILKAYRDAFSLTGASLYTRSPQVSEFVFSSSDMMPKVHRFTVSPTLLDYLGQNGRVYRPGDGEYNPTEAEASFTRETGAFAIVPLMMKNGEVNAVVVLGKQIQDEPLIYEDYDLMKTIAKHAALALLSFRLSAELGEAREIAAATKISAFVIHDLKNLAASLTLMLNNADDYIGDREFQWDMLVTVRSTAAKMQGLIRRLKDVQEKGGLNKSIVDMNSVVTDGIRDLQTVYPEIAFYHENDSVMVHIDREEMEKVIANLVLNAIEACNGRIDVAVSVESAGDMVCFSVKDGGEGMTEEFRRDHLFKPFRTTKKKGLGIGLFQCKQIVEAHGGRIEVMSERAKGSVFAVYLPAGQQAETLVGS